MFITPNLVNDGHDTTIDFVGDFINYWLTPLLANPNFNTNRTLILITFDENDTYNEENRIWTLLFGGGVPTALHGTTDPTFYSHYSCLSSVEANWGLGSLGRGDTNKTMSNVFDYMITSMGVNYTNTPVTTFPLTNLTATIPGPLNPLYWIPFSAPDGTATGAGGGPVFIAPGTNLSMTAANAPAPVNLTALNETLPDSTPASTGTGTGMVSPTPTSASAGLRVGAAGLVLAIAAGVVLLL